MTCRWNAMCASTSSGDHSSIGGKAWLRLRAATVVLEKQVLRQDRLLVSWAAPLDALHLVSGAGESFSTWHHSFGSRSSLGGGLLRVFCLRIVPSPRLPNSPLDLGASGGQQQAGSQAPVRTPAAGESRDFIGIGQGGAAVGHLGRVA